jgi:hypothetical protein
MEKNTFFESLDCEKAYDLPRSLLDKFLGNVVSFDNGMKSLWSTAANVDLTPDLFSASLSLRAAKPAPPRCPVERCITSKSSVFSDTSKFPNSID